MGASKYLGIHTLVAKHFLDNPERKRTVNHKNGNRRDNRWWNLEWNTDLENNKHAKRTGLNKQIGETHHAAKLTKKDVLEIILLKEETETIAKKYDISSHTVNLIKRGETWSQVTGITYKKHHRKLKSNEIIDIYLSQLNPKQLSEKYNVTTATVRYIKNGISHSGLTRSLKK